MSQVKVKKKVNRSKHPSRQLGFHDVDPNCEDCEHRVWRHSKNGCEALACSCQRPASSFGRKK